jgi:glycolate oxidase iron-sulfur subunit
MCGLCLPHCPSYAVTRNEPDSPRGRLALMATIASAQSQLEAHPSLDRCLACGRCEGVCPANVRFIEALTLTRVSTRPGTEHWSGRAARQMPGLRRWRWPVAKLAIATRRWLPSELRRRLNLDGLATTAAQPTHRGRMTDSPQVTVLAGCTADAMEGRALASIAEIVRKLGLSLQLDRDHCCGALAEHLGRGESVRVRQLPAGTSIVAINSGCMAQWQKHYAPRAVTGIATWLDDVCARHAQRLIAKPLRIAVHLPCSQQAQPDEVAALRRLLGRLPGATVLDLPAQPGCCGAAGTYFLNQPGIAQTLSGMMADQIRALAPERVISANGACRAQLAQALFDLDADIRVMHPAELLADYLDETSA